MEDSRHAIIAFFPFKSVFLSLTSIFLEDLVNDRPHRLHFRHRRRRGFRDGEDGG